MKRFLDLVALLRSRRSLNLSNQGRQNCRKLAFEGLEERALLAVASIDPCGPPQEFECVVFDAPCREAPVDLSSLNSSNSLNPVLISEQIIEAEPIDSSNSRLIVGDRVFFPLTSADPAPLYGSGDEVLTVGSDFLFGDGLNSSGGPGSTPSVNITLDCSWNSILIDDEPTTGDEPAEPPHILLERREGNINGSFSIEDADSLRVAIDGLPLDCYAYVRVAGTAIRNNDYTIYSLSPNSGLYQPLNLNSTLLEFKNVLGSGGGAADNITEYYIVPKNNSSVQNKNKVIELYVDFAYYSGGGVAPTLDYSSNGVVSTTIIDDDVEFVSQCDYAENGTLPDLPNESDPTATGNFTRNSDFYDAYVFYDVDAENLNGESLTFLAPIKAVARNTALLGNVYYSISHGNESGYFSINPNTGVITASASFYNLSAEDRNFVLTIRAELPGNSDDYDEASLGVHVRTLQVNPYTPETTFSEQFVLPKSSWSQNGVGIRRNNDFDCGAFLQAPDSELCVVSDDENDLVKVCLNFPQGNGLAYKIERSSGNLDFWKSSTKQNGMYSFNNDGECYLTGSGCVWAEYIGYGDDCCTLSVKVFNQYTGVVLQTESLVFRPYNSCVVILGGYGQNPNEPDGCGIFILGTELYKAGYNVYMYNENDCGYSQNCETYRNLVNQINYQGIENLAIFGYGRGGGSVYELSRLLHKNVVNEYSDISGAFDIKCTAYVDAIKEGGVLAENRRPWDSEYHLNYYQQNSWSSGGFIGDECDNSENHCVNSFEAFADINHFEIDDLQYVQDGLEDLLESYLPISNW